MLKINKINIYILFCSYSVLIGCKKFIEADLPIDKTPAKEVFNQSSTAIAVMSGIYASFNIEETSFTGHFGPSIIGSLLSDELVNRGFGPDLYANNVNGGAGVGLGLWINNYKRTIFRVNSLIEGVNGSEKLPQDIKNTLIGEAKFVRALTYFHLVNFFGDVPLVLTTDQKTNANIPRTSSKVVYEQVVSDLLDAQNLLKNNYLDNTLLGSTGVRVRPNKWAATALLARVYLYQKKWFEAEQESGKIIQEESLYRLAPISNVFENNSSEAIWLLQPNFNHEFGTGTPDGRLFFRNNDLPNYTLNPHLSQSFEVGDLRKLEWTRVLKVGAPAVEYIVASKYKDGLYTSDRNEYTVVLRLAEQYLIRSEARVHLGKLTGLNSAEDDLNTIRFRSGLGKTSAVGEAALLNAISRERYVELFCEYGHRWFDLKRTEKINERMDIITPTKGGIWFPFKALLPIPYSEIKYNPGLRGNQNPGYAEQ